MSEDILSQAMRSLAWDRSSTPEELERVARWAIRCKDDATLLELLARDELPDAVDELCAAVSNARVRTAWIRRPGRSVDDIVNLVGNETRESVLAAVAAAEGLPEVVYSLVLERARGTRPLCELLEAGHVSEAIRHGAAAALSQRTGKLTAAQRGTLWTMATGDTGVRDAVLAATDDLELAQRALRDCDVELSRTQVQHLVEVAMAPLRSYESGLRAGRQPHVRQKDLAAALAVTARLVLEDPELSGQRCEVEQTFRFVTEHWARQHSTRPHEVKDMRRRLDECFESLSLGGLSAGEIRQLVAAGDGASFDQAVDLVLSHTSFSNPEPVRRLANSLAQDLARSPLATGDVLAQLVTVHGVREVAAQRPGLSVQDAVMCVLSSSHRSNGQSAIGNCVDPHAAVSAVLADERATAYGGRALAVVFGNGELIDDEQLGEVPATVLKLTGPAYQSAGWERAAWPLVARCARWLLDRVDDDPVRWRLLVEMADGFEGTLGELVSVVELSC